ncbi:MAG: glycosyltransferase family 39 protein [Dehalococcoidia bacterium]|nr:glycosyltransferase family 39 protein [Dehalococcoidia bacterium]
MIPTVLIAFGLRTWGLGVQSIWLDEGISIRYASEPLGALIASVISQDLHPPFYYVALHYCMILTGSSEYAIRFLSAVVGLLAVPTMYQLAKSLLLPRRTRSTIPEWTGIAAAVLVAVSPFMVYYSQEARNYGMVTVWTIMASLALWKAQEGSRMLAGSGPAVGWWLAYVGFATLTLYTHYFGVFVLLAHVVYLGIISLRRRRLPLMGLAALAATGILYLPWISPALIQLRRMNGSPDFWAGALSLQSLLERLFTAFALGPKAQGTGLALIAFGVLLLVGIVSLVRVKDAPVGRGEVFLLLYLLVPLSIMYFITARAPKFAERYVIMAAPAFYLLLARGLALPLAEGKELLDRGKRRGWALVGFFVAVTVAILSFSTLFTYQALTSPDYARDNNRAAVRYIEANTQPGDAILLMMNAPHAFQYYYTGDLPWYGLQPGDDFQTAAAELNRITGGKQRLWVYLWNQDWADPARFVLDSLEETGPSILPDRDFQGIQVRLYSLATKPVFTADFHPRNPLTLKFEDKIELLGFDLPAASQSPDGSSVVTLYWKALQPLKEDDVVSLRLKRNGQYWGHREVRPTSYFYPTTSWKVGPAIRGRITISPLPGTPPGEYQVEIALHSLGAQGPGRDLNIVDAAGAPQANSAILGTISLQRTSDPPTLQELGLGNSQPELLRDGVSLLGAQTVASALKQGDPLLLTVFWEASERPKEADRVTLRMLDSHGASFTFYDGSPVGGDYPTDRWQTGEIVRDQYTLAVPNRAAPGAATIQVTLSGVAGPPSQSRTLASLHIQERLRTMDRPPNIQHSVGSNLGDTIELVGYDLSSDSTRPGGSLRLVLYWRDLRETNTSYTVFTHLLDQGNRVWAQQDSAPVNDTYLTTAWLQGEYVRDEYELNIDRAAAPGVYTLEVGMYDPANGQRLPIMDREGKPADNRILLEKVSVRP